LRVTFWGVRGSLATPEAGKLGYGGNTCCVHVELPEAHLVLDAGTGIRLLGEALAGADERPIVVLLTHLHLDHIQGLLFFAPLFERRREVLIYGPADERVARADLRTSLARFLSAPLSPVELRELPAQVRFAACPATPFDVHGVRVRAEAILHRGLTLGFHVTGPDGRTLAYLPDHEPALSGDLARGDLRWLSGGGLARGADLLIHDGQYSEEQYRTTRGWGHSVVGDAVRFAARVGAGELLLTHHDPGHDDVALDALAAHARDVGSGLGLERVGMAREGSSRA
jgi:phosphoribosyl 1,2-cyclic phosphodiesterase